jgi:hypothetical protein
MIRNGKTEIEAKQRERKANRVPGAAENANKAAVPDKATYLGTGMHKQGNASTYQHSSIMPNHLHSRSL